MHHPWRSSFKQLQSSYDDKFNRSLWPIWPLKSAQLDDSQCWMNEMWSPYTNMLQFWWETIAECLRSHNRMVVSSRHSRHSSWRSFLTRTNYMSLQSLIFQQWSLVCRGNNRVWFFVGVYLNIYSKLIFAFVERILISWYVCDLLRILCIPGGFRSFDGSIVFHSGQSFPSKYWIVCRFVPQELLKSDVYYWWNFSFKWRKGNKFNE